MAALPSWLIVYLIEILKAAPLASATAWFLLAILQVYRDRWHTWTESFFLGACFFAGSYALCDWFFFTARSDASAYVYALASLTSLTLAALFVLLFTIVYIDRMRRWYWLFAGVTAALIPIEWIFAIDHVKAP